MSESSTITQLNTPAAAEKSSINDQPVTPSIPSNERILEGLAIEPPLSQYESVHNMKYTVKYFNLPDVFKMPDNPLDRYDLKNNILRLENFIKFQTQSRNIPDTLQSYQEILNGLLEKIGGTADGEMPHIIISRLGNYIKYIQKQVEEERNNKKSLFQYG